jgi:serine/threonine protein kinase
VSLFRFKIEPLGEPPLFLELSDGRYLFGRGPECEVRIDHDGMSRRHALLVIEDGRVWVEDLFSSNGTSIDGESVGEAKPFSPGQELSLGQGSVRVEFAEGSREAGGCGRFKGADIGISTPDLFYSNYLFKSEIARGGMGTVLEAEDLNTGRTVAIKKMLQGSAASAEGQFRFQQEARVMGWLEHANVVPMHELGVNEKGVSYYTMKRVRGVTLQALLRGIRDGDEEVVSGYPLTRLLDVFQKVCDGVAFAHSRGVVHRDLKPENVLVGAFGEVMLLDWGLAKVMPGSPLRNSIAGRSGDVAEVGDLPEIEGEDASRSGLFRTREGAVIGTPNYMPPEQAEGLIGEIDTRSDIFSLGGILYSILTLRPPVTGEDVREVLANMRDGYIPPPVIYNKVRSARLPDGTDGSDAGRLITLRHCPGGLIPEALSRVAMHAMAKAREDRYQAVADLQAEVDAWLNGRVTRAEEAGYGRQLSLFVGRHRRVLLASVLVLLCGIFFVLQSVREERKLQVALTELRKGVPLIEADMKSLVTGGEFERALTRVDTLLVFLPDDPAYRLQRANLLQSLTRFDEAAAAFAEAGKLGAPADLVSSEIKACREFAAMAGAGGLDVEGIEGLVFHLRSKNRFAEAKRLALAHGLGGIGESLVESLDAFRSLLREQGASEKLLAGLKLDNVGRLGLDLRGQSVTNLIAVTGVPFEVMDLAGTKVADLRPLRGMPLRKLDISGTPVAELEPLVGMQLVDLDLSGTSVSDLRHVNATRLERLDVSATKIVDLSPLRGGALKHLSISRTAVAELGPLAGQSVERFVASGCGALRRIDALHEMPLTYLDLSYSGVAALGPLAKSKVRHVNLSGVPATDFEVLRNWKLNSAWLNDCKITDFSVFREMALEQLHAARVPVKDFSPLALVPLKQVTLSGTAVVDLKPFSAKNLDHLDLSFTRVADLAPLTRLSVGSLMLHGCNGVGDWGSIRNIRGLRRLSAPTGTVPRLAIRKLGLLAEIGPDQVAKLRDQVWRDTAQIETFWKKHGRPVTAKQK